MTHSFSTRSGRAIASPQARAPPKSCPTTLNLQQHIVNMLQPNSNSKFVSTPVSHSIPVDPLVMMPDNIVAFMGTYSCLC